MLVKKTGLALRGRCDAVPASSMNPDQIAGPSQHPHNYVRALAKTVPIFTTKFCPKIWANPKSETISCNDAARISFG